jgi:integrase
MWLECVALRNACYIFVASLSMMRDSEVRAITRNSVVEHYGAPAVTSTKRKRDPDRPTERWWIIEPVAQAIFTASPLSEHPDLAFAGVRGTRQHRCGVRQRRGH